MPIKHEQSLTEQSKERIAYMLIDSSDIAISPKPFMKKDAPGVVWLRLNGLFPNYGSAVQVGTALKEMLAEFGIKTEMVANLYTGESPDDAN